MGAKPSSMNGPSLTSVIETVGTTKIYNSSIIFISTTATANVPTAYSTPTAGAIASISGKNSSYINASAPAGVSPTINTTAPYGNHTLAPPTPTIINSTIPFNSSSFDPSPLTYGLAYSAFRNHFNDQEDPNSYAADFFQNLPRFADPDSVYPFEFLTCGIAPTPNLSTDLYIDGRPSPNGRLPGQNTTYPSDLSDIAVLMQGYFILPDDGTYSFSASFDDFGLLWLGQTAFDPWKTSSNGMVTIDGPGNRNLTKGTMLPMTALWANAGGPGYFTLNVTLPNGTLLTNWSESLVQPLESDPWIPRPRNNVQNTFCPALDPVYNYLCGLQNSRPYYHGSGMAVNETSIGILPAHVSNYNRSLSNCQAANRCRIDTQGCWFALYRTNSTWACVSYGVEDPTPPPFTVPQADVQEALGYGEPCLR